MKIQLIRHATLIININNTKLLVDPILASAGAYPPIEGVPNQNYNPLVELPISLDELLSCDAVLLTHTHSDHFDNSAAKLLPKSKPVLCQPEDEAKLMNLGFKNVFPVNNTLNLKNITFTRTGGQHGHGEIARQMAPVSGYVITSDNEPSFYLAGDTVWCDEVKNAIEQFNPKIIICNTGSAQFSYGKPITMSKEDLQIIASLYPWLKIIAVHLEAWNHCRLTRKELKDYSDQYNFSSQLVIPDDGEMLTF